MGNTFIYSVIVTTQQKKKKHFYNLVYDDIYFRITNIVPFFFFVSFNLDTYVINYIIRMM